MYQAEHVFTVSLEDPDGNEVAGFKAEGRFRVGASPDMELGEPTALPVVLPVVGLTIQRPGTYIFVLRLNKLELARLKIHAMQVPIVQQLGFMPLRVLRQETTPDFLSEPRSERGDAWISGTPKESTGITKMMRRGTSSIVSAMA